jgi:hypothetical protein
MATSCLNLSLRRIPFDHSLTLQRKRGHIQVVETRGDPMVCVFSSNYGKRWPFLVSSGICYFLVSRAMPFAGMTCKIEKEKKLAPDYHSVYYS